MTGFSKYYLHYALAKDELALFHTEWVITLKTTITILIITATQTPPAS
jgi:hypothetical protein